jgi:hypothetical protein
MKVKKYLTITVIILVLFVAFVVISQSPFSYKGKVIDADTGEPIEGAVVMLIWYRNHAFSGADYFKSRETFTDKSGIFFLKGRYKINFVPITHVDEPTLLIFKGSYKYFENPWVLSVFKENHMKKKIIFEQNSIIFKLKKLLTTKEREKHLYDYLIINPEIPYDKRKLFMEELNREEEKLGLEPSKY